MDDRTARLVQEEIRRSSRSLLQYLADAIPWTSAEDRDTLDRLRRLTEEDREAVAALARLLRRHRVAPPYLGAYPEPFTTLNDLSLDRLLPLLVEHHGRDVALLEGELARVQDPEARLHLERLLEVKRRHLAELAELSKTHPRVGSRV